MVKTASSTKRKTSTVEKGANPNSTENVDPQQPKKRSRNPKKVQKEASSTPHKKVKQATEESASIVSDITDSPQSADEVDGSEHSWREKFEHLKNLRQTEVELELEQVGKELEVQRLAYEDVMKAMKQEIAHLRTFAGVDAEALMQHKPTSASAGKNATETEAPFSFLNLWYQQLSGIEMKKLENDIVECAVVSDGDNRPLKFSLSLNEEGEMEYTPLFVNDQIKEHLPEFLTEEIEFAKEEAPMFMAKLLVSVRSALQN